MNNPYQILNLSQNANKNEIKEAQIQAMRNKKYPLKDIATAAKQLLDPSKRLAADFMLPTKIKSKRLQKITIDIEVPVIDINKIDDNAFDSL